MLRDDRLRRRRGGRRTPCAQTDINLAFYPEALYVIVGLKSPEPDVRAWRIVDGQVSEAELEIEEDGPPPAA